MGVAQIMLDNLNLSNIVIGWYRLFGTTSMVSGPPSVGLSRRSSISSLDSLKLQFSICIERLERTKQKQANKFAYSKPHIHKIHPNHINTVSHFIHTTHYIFNRNLSAKPANYLSYFMHIRHHTHLHIYLFSVSLSAISSYTKRAFSLNHEKRSTHNNHSINIIQIYS